MLDARALAVRDIHHWQELQSTDPRLSSPFFRPEFTIGVSRVRTDVRVATVRTSGRTVGYFPFQRGLLGKGRPVGGPLTDYQGLIAEPDCEIDGRGLLAGCGLTSWDFDHVPHWQSAFMPYASVRAFSPAIDLTNGFDAYRRQRQLAGSQQLKQIDVKRRRLERDVGTVEVVLDDARESALSAVLRWKSAQYIRTGFVDPFSYRWMVALLQHFHSSRADSFQGLLSTLSAGGCLIAGHMGLRSNDVLHYWVLAYDRSFLRYSPGLVLLAEIARGGASLGVSRIDLGKGDEHYKRRLANDGTELIEGRVQRPSSALALRTSTLAAARWLEARRVPVVSRAVALGVKRVTTHLRYR